MIEGRINLYSDTQTRPTQAMKEAMMAAPMGDEQHGQDPSVLALCEKVAELLGKETAVFLPSGTMCNELAILVHCRPGDEVYADRTTHIINSEAGGPAALAGVSTYPLDGDQGIYSAAQLQAAIRRESRYTPRPKLVVFEQTANLSGGTVWPLETMQAVQAVARERGLSLHIDGARLLNAVVASGISAATYGACADSVWLDLTKGLGCPVGAVLAGSQSFIAEVWRWKQRIGGALRQAGMLAAAGIYALDYHVERLADDHANARRLAELLTAVNGVSLVSKAVESNLVFLDVAETGLEARAISLALEKQGVNIGAFGPTVLRAVTHLDVSTAQIDEVGQIFADTVAKLRS
ncbi:MAG: threonine aldolase family protein [Chloroflexota bacterium]